jgi:hypothetical protein
MRHRVSLALLWLALAAPAAAQGPVPEAPSTASTSPAAGACDFDSAAASHREDSRRLGVTRGFSPAAAAAQAGPAMTAAEVAAALRARIASGVYPAGTRLLFYRRSGPALTAWLFRADGIAACGLASAQWTRVAAQVDALMGALEIAERQVARAARPIETAAPATLPAAAAAPPTAWPDAAIALSRTLFPGPVAAALREARHLVILPTADIGAIPFSALRPWGDATEIVDRLAVTILPNLAALARPAAPWSADEAFRRPLIVGDPEISNPAGWRVPPLPGAREEAAEVGAMLRASPLVGAMAAKPAVADRARDASLLYIATHGIADPDDPLDGGFLMLAGADFRAGWWTAREIQQSRLAARLAVLSACQTGLGQAHDGGMIGLARAFQLAGVPRVLMSLWNVDDAATRFLMTRFIRHARTERPSEALRLAMLEARARFEHPALWASFLMFAEAG